MSIVGVFFVFGAAIVFLVLPAFLLIGKWRTLSPDARRGILIAYLILLGAAGLLYWLIDRWASTGPLQ